MMETKERKLRLRRERERASRANEKEEQKEARTSLAQLMLHEHFLVIVSFKVFPKGGQRLNIFGGQWCPLGESGGMPGIFRLILVLFQRV